MSTGMESNGERNQTAFRRLKSEIDRSYPYGHWIAIDDGEIIADAPDFDRLTAALQAVERDSSDVFVAQAGVEYPEYIDILLADRSQ
ncbi:MAG: hypothetical protein KY476_24260 [Planctomycetes bacterium]|nr:hypothetical protein [Planctomycetota bacterium]